MARRRYPPRSPTEMASPHTMLEMSPPQPREVIRSLYGRLPESRRVKGLAGLSGRQMLLLRTLVDPLVPIDITLTDSSGVRYIVGTDPVDPFVVDDLTGKRRGMWFPDDIVSAPVTCVLDVGGHHGHYVAAAAHVWPNATIISVEPSRQAIERIERHIRANELDNVQIVPAAIADEAGTATLHHDPNGSWGSSLFPMGGDSSEEVALLPLNEVLDGSAPDVVKCNAEGGEFALIPQLLDAQIRPRLLTVMLHPEFGDVDALVATIRGAGFDVEQIGTKERPAIHARPIEG